jgi:hypothetical protein
MDADALLNGVSWRSKTSLAAGLAAGHHLSRVCRLHYRSRLVHPCSIDALGILCTERTMRDESRATRVSPDHSTPCHRSVQGAEAELSAFYAATPRLSAP